jgi:hypothetical protein
VASLRFVWDTELVVPLTEAQEQLFKYPTMENHYWREHLENALKPATLIYLVNDDGTEELIS